MTNVTAEGEGPFRLERLRGVEAELGREICGKLATLYDHKGVLFVDWAERPSTHEIATVIEVWDAMRTSRSRTTMSWEWSWPLPLQDIPLSRPQTIPTGPQSNTCERRAIF